MSSSHFYVISSSSQLRQQSLVRSSGFFPDSQCVHVIVVFLLPTSESFIVKVAVSATPLFLCTFGDDTVNRSK